MGGAHAYKKKHVSTCDWGSIGLFLGLLLFAFGGTLIIVILTEHQTELPTGHSLFDEFSPNKAGSMEETAQRMSRMERNIASSKVKPLSTKAKEENPNLLDMSKKPTQLNAPVTHDPWFDDWFWGGKRRRNQNNDNKKEEVEDPWKIKDDDEYHNLLKELFPSLYADKEDGDKKDEKNSDKKKKTSNPWGNLFQDLEPENNVPPAAK